MIFFSFIIIKICWECTVLAVIHLDGTYIYIFLLLFTFLSVSVFLCFWFVAIAPLAFHIYLHFLCVSYYYYSTVYFIWKKKHNTFFSISISSFVHVFLFHFISFQIVTVFESVYECCWIERVFFCICYGKIQKLRSKWIWKKRPRKIPSLVLFS